MFFFKPQTKDDILQLMAKKMKHFERAQKTNHILQ